MTSDAIVRSNETSGDRHPWRLSDPWGSLSVVSILRVSARARADRLAVSDSPDRTEWTDGAPQRLSYRDLGLKTAALARVFEMMRLDPGDRVLVALPNIVESPAIALAAMEAGLLPVVISASASCEQMGEAVMHVGARAIITLSRLGTSKPIENAMKAAAQCLGVRYVAAFGENVPSGVIALDKAAPAPNLRTSPLPDPHAPALLSLRETKSGLLAIEHSHHSLVSTALMTVHGTPLAISMRLLQAVAPTSGTAFAATVVAPLLTGAEVLCHGPFDPTLLSEQMAIFPDAVVALTTDMDSLLRGTVLSPDQPSLVIAHNSLPSIEAESWPRLMLLSIEDRITLPLQREQRGRVSRRFFHPIEQITATTIPYAECCESSDATLIVRSHSIQGIFGHPTELPIEVITNISCTPVDARSLLLSSRTVSIKEFSPKINFAA